MNDADMNEADMNDRIATDPAQVVQPLPSSDLSANAFADVLALADDEFVIGHRHSEWLGLSPFLEEDLTLSSIAQDELGHARALYRIIWPSWAGREQGLVRRPTDEWRSCSLTERQSPTWEWSLVRHAVYDTLEPHRWRHLCDVHGPEIESLEDLVTNVHEEETFHRRHAHDLMIRIGSANETARAKLQAALDDIGPDVDVAMSTMAGAQAWGPRFLSELTALCSSAHLASPSVSTFPTQPGSRRGRHRDFASVTESLLAVLTFDPKATW